MNEKKIVHSVYILPQTIVLSVFYSLFHPLNLAPFPSILSICDYFRCCCVPCFLLHLFAHQFLSAFWYHVRPTILYFTWLKCCNRIGCDCKLYVFIFSRSPSLSSLHFTESFLFDLSLVRYTRLPNTTTTIIVSQKL